MLVYKYSCTDSVVFSAPIKESRGGELEERKKKKDKTKGIYYNIIGLLEIIIRLYQQPIDYHKELSLSILVSQTGHVKFILIVKFDM